MWDKPSQGNRARGRRVGPTKTIPKGIKDQNSGGEHAAYMLTLLIVDNKPNISKNKDFLLYES